MVTIRQAHRTDALHIAAVHVETWRTVYPRLLPESMLAGLSVEAEQTSWERLLSGGPTETWVGLVEGTVVGWAVLGPPQDDDLDPALVHELHGLYLLPRFWGRGVGRKKNRARVRSGRGS